MSDALARRMLLAMWLAVSLLLVLLAWPSIKNMGFRDGDDMMRLVQVRDWLAGQSWFDVTQFRMNPPAGAPMHWSRIVDLPIAGIILIATPLLGGAVAESVAIVLVPLLLLLVTLLLVHALARQLGLEGWNAIAASALTLVMLSIVIQFLPMRIDHHGWQILLAAGVAHQVARGDARYAGLLAGLIAAIWFQISAEALPYAVGVGGIFAVRYLCAQSTWTTLRDYALALTVASLALLLVIRGTTGALAAHCDAVSLVYLAPLTAASLALVIVGRFSGADRWTRRIRPLIAAAVIGAVVYWDGSGQCRSGPFAALPPLVHDLWYRHVLEGMPIWEQDRSIWGMMVGPSLIGIGAYALAARDAEGAMRARRIEMLVLLVLATAVSLIVARAMAVAHLWALPALGWLVARMLGRISLFAARPRLGAGFAALLLALPAGAAIANAAGVRSSHDEAAPRCPLTADVDRLDQFAPATVFAPIDVGPAVLLMTDHRVIASAHHRNVDGMVTVIRAFTARPQEAEAIVRRTGARYLALCPMQNEVGVYARTAPNGLAAALMRGQVPAWLEPVPLSEPERAQGALTIYRLR